MVMAMVYQQRHPLYDDGGNPLILAQPLSGIKDKRKNNIIIVLLTLQNKTLIKVSKASKKIKTPRYFFVRIV